ncbi:hypothetical protein GSF67_07180 [Agrobacterium sp. CGMCC 11546]|nr:hypothetical protein GSF67_07180 [Agrobacterium sp. CGMCC 11546]
MAASDVFIADLHNVHFMFSLLVACVNTMARFLTGQRYVFEDEHGLKQGSRPRGHTRPTPAAWRLPRREPAFRQCRSGHSGSAGSIFVMMSRYDGALIRPASEGDQERGRWSGAGRLPAVRRSVRCSLASATMARAACWRFQPACSAFSISP